jgi:DNA-binding MarR family transcriptional regulator
MAGIDLIWQQYLEQGGAPDATSFGVWLIQNTPPLGQEGRPPAFAGVQEANGSMPQFETMDLTTRSAILISRLERFLHHLNKPVMKEAGLSADEFVVLATLLYLPRSTKTQLLRQCLIEIPTGSELLKRMKQAGLILERANPDDGRSTVISISAKGRQQVFKTFGHLEKVEDALSILSAAEKETLHHLLDKLDKHHSQRHDIRQVSHLMTQYHDNG